MVHNRVEKSVLVLMLIKFKTVSVGMLKNNWTMQKSE